jgi:hypothetical protein
MTPISHPLRKKKKKTTRQKVGLIALLSLAATSVGLAALRPRMQILQEPPLIKTEALSVPFRIQNSAYFEESIKNALCYYREIKYGAITLNDNLARAGLASGAILSPDGSKTIYCFLVKSDGRPPTSADIALVVDYKYWIVPFYTFRKYERFVGQYGDHWQWVQQPTAEIEAGANTQIEFMEAHN